MERAISESSPWRMEESERFASQDVGLIGWDSGRANDSHANERAMLMSPPIGHSCTQDRGSSSFFDCDYDSEDVSKGSTPPISLAPQAPRALDLASKLSNSLPRKISSFTQVPQGQDGNADSDLLRTLSAAESSKAPLGGHQGPGGRSADVKHIKLHDVPTHKHQVYPNAQDHVGMKDTAIMPAEERDCSQTQEAGSIL